MESSQTNVLLVDDEEDILTSTKMLLKRMSFARPLEVSTANSKAAALLKIKEKNYDIVITDCVMETELAGIELAVQVRKVAPKWTRILIRSGQLGVNANQEARDAIDYYLGKSVCQEDFTAVLRNAVIVSSDLRLAAQLEDVMDAATRCIMQSDTIDEFWRITKITQNYLSCKYGTSCHMGHTDPFPGMLNVQGDSGSGIYYISMEDTGNQQQASDMEHVVKTWCLAKSSIDLKMRDIENKALIRDTEMEKMRNLSMLVAGVAHEVNTPLAVCMTTVPCIEELVNEILASPNESSKEDLVTSLGLLTRNLQRAAKLVASFKKLSVKQVESEVHEYSLKSTIEESIAVMSMQMRHITMKLKMDDRNWIGNHGSLSQIMINLFQNIIRYAFDKNSKEPTVSITIKDGAETMFATSTIEITVIDNGKGMSETTTEKIFAPFYTTDRQNGTGLGMAMVYNIVTQQMLGQIKVTSKLEEGTSIIMTLPA